jgi:hypothetical protein
MKRPRRQPRALTKTKHGPDAKIGCLIYALATLGFLYLSWVAIVTLLVGYGSAPI